MSGTLLFTTRKPEADKGPATTVSLSQLPAEEVFHQGNPFAEQPVTIPVAPLPRAPLSPDEKAIQVIRDTLAQLERTSHAATVAGFNASVVEQHRE